MNTLHGYPLMQPILPYDILFLIINHTDQATLHQFTLTCKSLSKHALRLLWNRPYISTCCALLNLTDTLKNMNPSHDYQEWITGLAIHTNCQEEIFPFDVFSVLKSLRLEVISFQYLDSYNASASYESQLQEFMCAQLDQGIAEIYLYNCSTDIVDSIFRSIQTKRRCHLTSLNLYECCFISDRQVAQVVKYCPNLLSLRLIKSGYFSDLATTAIACHCHHLNILVVTLPSNIIQSNTITMSTVEALRSNCHHLKQFICPGQIRIAEYLMNCRNDLTYND